MRWLEQRGRTWYAVQAVPRPLRPKLGGKRKLLKSLETRDLHVAIARRHGALAEFQRIFDRASAPAAAEALTDAALSWRRTFDKFDQGDFAEFHVSGPDGPIQDEDFKRGFAANLLAETADAIESNVGREAARTFVGIAKGTATPILLHVDSWLREGGTKGPLNPRTAAQYKADVNALAEWAKALGVTTVEGITKAVAGRYVTEQLVTKGVHWATGNRKITAAGSYWRWLRKRAGVEGHPWSGQSLAKDNGARTGEKSKRPFTAAEVVALLGGDADAELADAMRVAALTGMRLDELYRLTVADCAGGWFSVRRAKTAAGVRRVPVHSDLTAIVAQRVEGKTPDAFLFHEAGPVREGRERSMSVSKRFGRYRQTVAVHDRAEGVRHSRVDFHSWRRWFITEARNAGIDRAVVAAVAGHEVGNITDDTYHGGPADGLMRACVEAVRLPNAG
jgi:integrase